MNINKLEYFTTIVKCNFNITKAAELLYISQPALSKAVVSFEKDENVKLFFRSNNRLTGLTPIGEILYHESLELLSSYNKTMDKVKNLSHNFTGRVRIGIPSLLLTYLFDEILPQLIIEHPLIKFDIIEQQTAHLKKMFLERELDIIVMLAPTHFSTEHVNECIISTSQYIAIMSVDNQLARRTSIKWNDLNKKLIAIPDETTTSYTLIQSKLTELDVFANIVLSVNSWDFCIKSTKRTEIITILPELSYQKLDPEIISVNFENPITWNAILCSSANENNESVNFIYNKLQNYFLYNPNYNAKK